MRSLMKHVLFAAVLLALSGCVTSHYKDSKGRECTRRYFTPFGVWKSSCQETASSVAASASEKGTELKIAPAAPAPSLAKTTPAETIRQSVKAATQAPLR